MPDVGRPLRWKYPHPSEDAPRAAVIARMDAWWKTFSDNQARLAAYFDRRERWDLPSWVQQHLFAVTGPLAWEFGPARRASTGHRLMITPESDRHQRPLIDVLLSRAPELPGWEFYSYRLPESFETAAAWVKGRTGVDVTDWRAHAQTGGQGRVDVFASPPRALFRSTDKDRTAFFAAIEYLIGEERLDHWIGAIDVERHPAARPLAELPVRISDLIEESRRRLPETPCYQRAESTEWSLLELKPTKSDDYANQLDLFVAKTMDLDLWKAQHGSVAFHSPRFSRQGETFLYLKTDGSEELDPTGFEDKSQIEDAIDQALAPGQLGCHVGGGTGLRYSYVDLAVTDVEAAVRALLPVLRAGKLPPRSWLLFFDAELADEWIPVWDHSPPPPR